MKQIYRFDTENPPALTQAMLERELERRRLRRQTILLELAGLLFQAAALLIGLLTMETYPVILPVCLCHLVISAAGSGAIAVIYAQKGGEIYG